ncbi:MAG: beta-glucosidase [Bacteroidales bacterium]|jgi:beta-glucosidase|nr:beta-glucosidase [Bacteroidota bacterium]NLN99810.1 beta-glucosidase [Bacteroidales bacterium]
MKKILLYVAGALCVASMSAQPKLNKNNIDEVLNAMTLEEKASLLVGSGRGQALAGITTEIRNLVPGAAGTTCAIPRLGIPGTVLADGPAGLRISPTRPNDRNTYYCTGFPVGTVMASTWNTPLVEEFTTAMGEEVKEYGVDVLLAPGMNLHRNPLCGRNFEYFSEDPLLTGKVAAAYVKGIQSNGVGVSAKHYAANNAETNRNMADSRVSRRALRELYLKGFEIMVKEADPWTIMSSYNKLNGEFTQQSRGLLTTVLRDEWGYNGIVMTDWGAKEGTVKAVNAGNDLMEPGNETEVARIIAGVREGNISEEQLNTNVRRMLEYIVRTPRFAEYKYSNKPDLTAHAELVRKSAAEGLVLLKNDGAALPMQGVKNVALFGIGSYDMIAGGTGSGNVNKPYIRSLDEGLAAAGFNVYENLKEWYASYVDYSRKTFAAMGGRTGLLGGSVLAEMDIPRSYIERSEQANDIAIITISRNAGEGADRKAVDGDWTLSGQERQMIQQVSDVYHAADKKVIVVLNIGGVIETASWKQIPDAILLAWTPGQEVGYTIADVLCGKSYPSGKLPMTFPVNYLDLPSSANFPYNYQRPQAANPLAGIFGQQPQAAVKDVDYVNYEEDIYVGYRYFTTADKDVSYPFGYGLGYTTFAYSNAKVQATADGFTATVTVKNTGEAAGKEIVQLYVSAPAGGLEKPACELKGFAKTRELQPGESQTLTIPVDKYTLASFNEGTSQWETAAGTYTVRFAADVQDVRATAQYKLAKPEFWKVNDVLAPQGELKTLSLK